MDKLLNIAAFLLPIGLFTYFGILGTATLSLLHTQRNLLQNLLLSPAVGIAFTLLPVFLFSRAGLPVKEFAIPLTICSFFLSLAIILYRKPIIPFSRYIGFALLFFIALCLTGRPLLHFGFNWISYANDDMANYCLGALRFLNHGYLDVPNSADMLQGKDYSQYYWFTFVPGMIRSGSELFLAWLSGVAHCNPLQIFMPLILTLHLTLISSIGAMVLVSKKYRKIALITSLFLACSALTTLATLYQLIAQVLGLSLLIAIGAIFQSIFVKTFKPLFFRQSLLFSVLICTLLISYPEIIPILGLACIAYFVVSLSRGWRPKRVFLILVALCLLESILLLNTYWFNIATFLHYQATAGLTDNKGDLFPYFLVPSGVADLWGLLPLATIFKEPFASLAIIAAFVFSGLAIFLSIKQATKAFFPAIISLLIILLGVYLCVKTGRQSGFSLFKLAMYIQPFMLAVIAMGIVELVVSRRVKIAAVIFFMSIGMVVQFSYLHASYGDLGQPYSELPQASSLHLASELRKLKKEVSNAKLIISEVPNVVSAKLQSLFLSDKNTTFPSSNIFFPIYAGGDIFMRTSPKSYEISTRLQATLLTHSLKLPFLIESSNKQPLINYFYKTPLPSSGDAMLLMETPLRSIFNRTQMVDDLNQNYVALPIESVSNHLMFVNSTLGQNYYLGESSHIGLYGLEKDYFYPESSVVSIGRYLLLQVVNPSKNYRLIFDFTKTLNHNGKHELPPAKIIADKNYSLSLVGRGSARAISNPFKSRVINGNSYFMLDMGTDATTSERPRSGLMLMYGRDVPLGHRLYVGHVRNISLISEAEYEQYTPPHFVSHFPSDLQNSNLEYSGIYEDGWFSEDVTLRLSQPSPQTKLIIKGLLPTFRKQDAPVFMTVRVDNEKNIVKKISPGPFQFQIDAPHGNAKRDIKLHFSDSFSLPKGDDRLVAVKIDLVGFKSKDIGRQYTVPSYIDNFINAFKNRKFEHSGVFEDGWVSKDVYFTLGQGSRESKLVIKGELPKRLPMLLLDVYLDDVKITESSLLPGPFNLVLTVPEGKRVRNIKLKFNKSFLLSKRDGRSVSVKIDKVGFVAG